MMSASVQIEADSPEQAGLTSRRAWGQSGQMRIRTALLILPLLLAGCERRQVLPPPKAVAIREDGVIALQLATFNIRYEDERLTGPRAWRERLRPAVNTLRRINPDIFGVQEALHGQVADLRASMTDYDFHGVGRDDGKRTGEYAGIFFKRDAFIPVAGDAGTFWLSDTPEVVGSMTWGNEFPRVAAWIRLTDRASGRNFYVFNTHFDHRNQASREHAASLLAQRIDQRQHPEDPVVLLGDFNANEGNAAVAYLRGQKSTLFGKPAVWKNGLMDPYELLNQGRTERTTLHLWRGVGSPIGKVDHILVSAGARVTSAAIVTDREPFPSDHFPVAVRIEFPPR